MNESSTKKYSHPEHQLRNRKARNIIRDVKYQKFGTDIHRHTVEFSKNTRTPSPPTLWPAALGQLFQLIGFSAPAQTGLIVVVNWR
jgi:hypothetical protein